MTQAQARNVYSSRLGILLTGATGFVGRAVQEVSGVTDWSEATLESLPPHSVIIHLGAHVSDTPEARDTNRRLDTEVVRAASSTGSRLIYASTNNVYGLARDCETTDALHPAGDYAQSKVDGESLVRSELGAAGEICRIPDVFGVGQRHGNFFRAIETSVQEGSPLMQFGAGAKLRTYIRVDDLARVLLWLVGHPPEATESETRVWNLGYGDSKTVAEIVATVAQETGLPVEHRDVPGDTSAQDVRTLRVTPLPEGTLAFPTCDAALRDYVRSLSTHPEREFA